MSKIIDKIRSRIPSHKKRMNEISFDIAAQIYEFMKKSDGMTQKEFAKKLGKKESEVSKWLSGGHNFTIETIAKIEEILGEKLIYVPMFAIEDLIEESKTSETENIVKNKSFDTNINRLIANISNNKDKINQSVMVLDLLKKKDSNQKKNIRRELKKH